MPAPRRPRRPGLEKKLAAVRQRRRKWFKTFEADTGMENLARGIRELADEEKALAGRLEELEHDEKAQPQVGREEVLDLARNIRQVVAGAGRN